MFVKTVNSLELTIFYFDRYGSYDDLLSHLDAYISSGPTLKELFFFDADAQFITPAQVKLIVPVAAKAAATRKPGGKTALMYGRLSLFGLGKIYAIVENKIVQKNWHTEVFNELSLACKWLEVPQRVIEESVCNDNQTDRRTFQHVIVE